MRYLLLLILLSSCGPSGGLTHKDDDELGVRCYSWKTWSGSSSIDCLYKSSAPELQSEVGPNQ